MDKYANSIVDGMVASDEPLVPRVDKFVGQKRWGADTPMFNSREELHGFLQGAGMAPGGAVADILDAGLYLSEGKLVDAIISGGAAVPFLGMGAGIRRMTSKPAWNRFLKKLDKNFEEYKIQHKGEQKSIRDDLRWKEAEDHWAMVDEKIAKAQKYTSEGRPDWSGYKPEKPDMSKFIPEEMATPATKLVTPEGPDRSTINKLMSWFKDKL